MLVPGTLYMEGFVFFRFASFIIPLGFLQRPFFLPFRLLEPKTYKF